MPSAAPAATAALNTSKPVLLVFFRIDCPVNSYHKTSKVDGTMSEYQDAMETEDDREVDNRRPITDAVGCGANALSEFVGSLGNEYWTSEPRTAEEVQQVVAYLEDALDQWETRGMSNKGDVDKLEFWMCRVNYMPKCIRTETIDQREKLAKRLLTFASGIKNKRARTQSPTSVNEHAAIVSAFENKYQDPNGGVPRLCDYVEKCHDYWKRQGFASNETDTSKPKPYSPFITLCQSSGWGKSRMVRELSEYLPVLYISFQDEESTGYPKRTKEAIEYLKDGTWFESTKRLNRAARSLRALWKQNADDPKKESKESKEPKYNSFDVTSEKKFWDDLQRGSPDHGSKEDESLDNQLVVVVFDEARGMFNEKVQLEESENLFLHSRRVLQKTTNLFGIYTDTSFKLSNFSPQSRHDSSARVKEDGTLLFHPFVPCHCMDVMKGAYRDLAVTLSDDWPINLGRPLWKTAFSFEKDLYSFALDKLKIKRNASDHNQFLAAMLVRLGLFLSPVASGTGDLVAKHMATALAIDEDRSGVLATYVSEPVLSLGASILWKQNHVLCEKLLPALRSALMRGQVLEGPLGEIVGSILLLIAMDKISTESDPAGPVKFKWCTVEKFLQKLGDEWEWDQLKTKIPRDANISVTHFIPWRRDFKVADLQKLAERRAGCTMRRNQDGADLLIPLWWKNNDKYTFGAILIQVKNCIKHNDMREVGYKMHPHYVFKEDAELKKLLYINIVMELGLGQHEAVNSRGQEERNVQIVQISTTPSSEGTDSGDAASSSGCTVEASVSKSYLHAKIPLDKKEYSLFRLKGLTSIPFVRNNQDLHCALNNLLLGPCDVNSWLEVHRMKKDEPNYENDLSTMVEIERKEELK